MQRITAFEEFHPHPLICAYIPLTAAARRWNIVKSTAPFWRIYWNNRPGAFIRQKNQRIALKPDLLVVIPPNTVFSTLCQTPRAINHFYIHFNCYPTLADGQLRIMARKLTVPVRAMVMDIIKHLKCLKSDARHLSHASATGGTLNTLRTSLMIRALIEWVLAEISGHLPAMPAPDARILKVMHYIEEQLGVPISNSELARIADMSVNAFCALFRTQTGRTPHVYLRDQRIAKACQLLHRESLSIKQIAEQTGFYDTHHFSRTFKRLQGVGPAEFRRQNENPFQI